MGAMFTGEQQAEIERLVEARVRAALDQYRAELAGDAPELDEVVLQAGTLPPYTQDIQRGGATPGQIYTHPTTVFQDVVVDATIETVSGEGATDKQITLERKELEVHSVGEADPVVLLIADIRDAVKAEGVDETVLTGVESKIPEGGSEDDRVLEFARKTLTVLASAAAEPVQIGIEALIRNIVEIIQAELPKEKVWVWRKATQDDVDVDSTLTAGQWLLSERYVYCDEELAYVDTVPHACPEYSI